MAASRTVFIDTAVSDYQTLAAQYDASVFNVVLLNAASSHADQIQSWLTAHNASATGINIVSASDSINGAFTPRVVFVDAGVADIGQVIAGVPANATVVVLDAGRDGVQQIHDYLAANAGKVGAIDIVTDLASVDVVSHGAPGEVTLGSTVLNADTLATYSKQLAEIGSHLSAGADLLLYGCDVASGTTGQQFISALAAATGADVAASTDLTGSAAAGGDWVLEANTGTIETAALDIAGYDGVLDSINVTSVSAVKFAPDSGTSSSDFITNVATQTITGTFAYTVSTNGQTPALKIWVSTTTGNNPTRYEGVLDTSTKIFTINNVPLATGADLPLRFWGSSSGNSQINIIDNGITKAFQPYTLDQIAPNAKVASLSLSSDTGSSQSDFITSVAAQTLSGKLNAVTVANEVVKISLDGGLSWQTASNTVGTIGFSLSGVTLPGSGTIQARVEDVAGNASDTFSQTFKVYTTAPTTSISTLRLSTDTGPSSTDFTTSVSAQTLSGTLSAPTSPDELVMISLDNGSTWQTASNTAGTNSFSLAGLNLSGSGTIKVRVDDKAGNSGAIYSQAFLVDATPPSAPGISTAAALTNNKAPVLTITAEADSTVQVYEGTTLLGTATQTATKGTYTFATASLADGSHAFTAKATDAAGNTSVASAPQSILVDTTAPSAPGISTAAALTNNKAPVLTITAEADSTVQVYEGITLLGTATQTATKGTYTFATTSLADGSHAFTAKATDAAGNVSAASTAQTITVDTVAPAPTITMAKDSGSGNNHLSNDAHLSFSALEQNATRAIQVDGNTVSAYDATALHDGQHSVTVTDTDAAGNAGSTSLVFTLDTTAPAPGKLGFGDLGRSGGESGPTNDRDFSLALTGNEAGSTVAYEVSFNGGAFKSTTAAQSALADGNYQFRAIVTDAAGNSATTDVASITIDATAPGVPVISTAAALTNNKAPVLTITAEADSTVQVYEGTTLLGTATQTATKGTYSFATANLADGSHAFTAKATDAAGNVSAAASAQTVTIDTVAPTPTITMAKDSGSGGNHLSNDAHLSFGALEQNATRVIQLDGNTVGAYDASALHDGQHTVIVTDTDAAGNAGSTSLTFTLDTTAPTPTAALANDSGSNDKDGVTNDASLTLSTLEDGATRVIKVDGTAVASYDPKSLKDGTHTIEVTDTDVAGNAGSKSYSFTLDTTAPAPTAALAKDTGSSDKDGVTNDASLTLNTLEDGATRVIKVDGTMVASYDPKSLKDGAHTVEVTDTDTAGNAGTKSISFTLDTAAPAPTAALAQDSGSNGKDGVTNDASLTFSTLEDGATRVIKVDGAPVGSYDPKTLKDGAHTVEVTDTDTAGNAGSKSFSFTLDTAAPAPTAALAKDSGSSDKDDVTNDASLTLSTLEDGATRVIKVDGVAVASYDPKVLNDGAHTVEVTDTDVAGNAGSKSFSFTLDTAAPAPTAALSQDSGSNDKDGITNDASLTLSMLEDGATRVIKVDGTVVAGYDPKSLKDGAHTVEVTDTDTAGNAGSKSYSFTLDTTAPAPTAALAQDSGSNDKDGITNDASLTLSMLEDGATRVIKVDGTVVAGYDPKSLKDGTHTVEVTDTDVAGNAGSKSYSFTLDTTAPAPTAALAQDSGSNDKDGITNDASLTLSMLEDGATRVIKVDGTVVAGYDPKSLKDGAHTVEVTDTDTAGNAGSKSYSFTLDTTAPAPTAALSQDSGSSDKDGVTNDASLSLSTLEDGATRVIKVDGTAVANYDPKSLKDGAHTVEVTDTDVAGNAGSKSYSFTLDTAAPAPTAALAKDTGSSDKDDVTNDASLTLSTLEEGATRVIKVDGAAVASYDPKALKDGSHTVEVTDTDTAGNAGSKSFSFTLDTAAPAPTAALAQDSGSDGKDGITNDASLSLSTLEDGATRVIKVDGTAVANYDPKSLKDGAHTVEVTDTDVAGNAGSKSYSFTLDTTAPAPTAALSQDSGSDGKDGITNDASLTLSTLEDGATRVIKVDGTAVANYDPKSLTDGTHTVEVTDTDTAGNAGSKSYSFTLDTTAPAPTAALAQDSGSDGKDGITNDASLSLSTLEDGATRVIKVDGTAVTSYDPKALKDGTHTIEVTDTDVAGNAGSKSYSFTLDTTAPAPTAALAQDSGSDGKDGITNDASLTFSTLEDGATRVIKVDGAAVTSYDPRSLKDGTHTVEVTDTDVAGNAGSKSFSFTLDTTAPVPTAALSQDSGSDGKDSITNDGSLTLSTLEDGGTRVIKVDGTVVSSYDPKTLKDGAHTVEVTDTDAAGNAGSKSFSFTLDTTAPAPTAALSRDSGSDGKDSITNDASLTLSTLEDGATRVIKVDGTAVASYDPKSLKDGTHTVEVTDTDVAGNAGSKSFSFTLDTTAPAPTAALAQDSGSNGNDGITNDASLTLSTLEDGATRVIKVDGAAVASYDPKSLKDGAHTVEVTDTDVAGNAGSKSFSFTLDTAAPVPTAALAKDTGSNGNDGVTSDASLSLGTLEDGATRVIKVDGTAVASYDSKSLKDGAHTVEVTDTDLAGNAGSKSISFTLDTTAPAPTAALAKDSGSNGNDGITNDASLTLSTLENGAIRVIKVDGNVVGSYDPKALTDGAHTVELTDTDAAGNAGSKSFSFSLDSKGPAFTSAASASVAENIGANQLVYKAVASDDHAFSYSLGGADGAKFDIGADGSVTLKDNPNYEGTPSYNFAVLATDVAGNQSTRAVTLNITNVNEAPTAPKISGSTIENVPVDIHVADSISDPDAGDKLTVSLNTTTAKLSWANTDPKAPTTLTNPVTHVTVDLSTLSVKASVAADGTVTLTPPAELDWMTTGQALKATFGYTVTDAGGLSSTESIELVMNGSTTDKGVNLAGGNGDDVLSGNTTNNAEDVLQGNNGNDTLNGYGGTDVLYGGNGNDKLNGGAGIDYLYGDNGDDSLDGGADGDYLTGGKGNDILTGGTGADKFVFAPQSGNDRITDFKASDGDMLFLTDFFATAPDWNTFVSKYVTDTGNDLLVSLPGATIVLTGVPNISDLAGHVVFGAPV